MRRERQIMLQAFITNLGRYNEGCLDGEYLSLPATQDEVMALLERIHIDGIRYEEIFITDYESDIDGLSQHLGEYESIDELNYLAQLLDDLQDYELELFAAAVQYGDHTGSVKDLINLAQNLDSYQLYSGIFNEDDLGRYYAEELCCLDVPEHLQNYIDYEAYGRDIDIESSGTFVDAGYIVHDGSFCEYYEGCDDLPDEHRIFMYPEGGHCE
ncbi:antirestriction protein ArdA [Oscillospiraceae bacterium OttesenSCG-928-F05]|nr:antirestriction protein ArdA [Oscillospiraceae bacterium OttesenSCG-928-F05]